MELARRSSFAELHSLVEELHLRRQEQGTAVGDFGHQAQLKTLIHLVHSYGDRQVRGEKPDGQLLIGLKKASLHLHELRPRGLLRRVLTTLDVSWAELLTAFSLILSEQRLKPLPGDRLCHLEDYVQRQRFLYFVFTRRMVRRAERPKYVVDEGELCEFVRSSHPWDRGWAMHVPLLPLQSNEYLLSPELLYDDLLQKYLELAMVCQSSEYQKYSLAVAENR